MADLIQLIIAAFTGFCIGLWFQAKILDKPDTEIKVHKIKGDANKVNIPSRATPREGLFKRIFKRKNK